MNSFWFFNWETSSSVLSIELKNLIIKKQAKLFLKIYLYVYVFNICRVYTLSLRPSLSN